MKRAQARPKVSKKIDPELFALWGRCLKGDREAKDELARRHAAAFPHHASGLSKERDSWALHTMYLHLTHSGTTPGRKT